MRDGWSYIRFLSGFIIVSTRRSRRSQPAWALTAEDWKRLFGCPPPQLEGGKMKKVRFWAEYEG